MENTEEKTVKGAESSEQEMSLEDRLLLTKMGRFKKWVSSQQEWEAYLLHKLEKEEKAKGDCSSSKDIGLFQRLKNVFKTPQESHFFLETETEEFINSKKDEQEESPDLSKPDSIKVNDE